MEQRARIPGAKVGARRSAAPSGAPVAAIVGGGTAGHIFPAIAIAEALVARGFRPLFIGSRDGMEGALLPKAGWPLEQVPSRPFFGVDGRGRLLAAATLLEALRRSRVILKRHRVSVVIGMGGHVSAGVLLAARSLGIPAALHEANVLPGLANRLARWSVARCYLGFPETRERLGGAGLVTVGTPVRREIRPLMTRLPAPPDPAESVRLLVLGGSLGSGFLNARAPDLAAALAARGLPIEVRHQAGAGDPATIGRHYRNRGIPARVESFIDDMSAAYGAAHFAVSCAGAGTLAELAVAGLPCLLVPLAAASEDHQSYNAAVFGTAAGSPWVRERDWQARALAETIASMLGSTAAWRARSQAVRSHARPRAAEAVADDLAGLLQDKAGPGKCESLDPRRAEQPIPTAPRARA